MQNKVEENVQFSHEIRKQMFQGTKIEPWHAAMMMLHMAHYRRYLVFFGPAYAFSSSHSAHFQEDNTVIENYVGQRLGSLDQS